MVKICSLTNYTSSNEEKYKSYFEKYPYPLHIFQKYTAEAIIEGHHVLVCAPTGSGKTFGGEFSIDYFVSKGKKVIYTTPIKALSNQKFYDFTHKYPQYSIGLITGDIKTNPDADCLIMTTEILLNKLYQINSNTKQASSSVSFDMDIQNELACVIFDEVHMINDQSRGHVWEQSIMMLPEHIQMVMLSATIDSPENFASWCQQRYPESNKEVYLARRNDRAVPLTHYNFITCHSSIFKIIKDKAQQQEIKDYINSIHVIQDSKGVFNEPNYFKMHKLLKLFETNQVYVKRQHVLNEISKYLVEKEMLPALCFVFSRKQLELCAKEVTTNLLEFDSKVPYTIRNECEQIMRKFPNYQEYLDLPDYLNLVSLLEKGIGVHHSGVMPPLREMVEILYSKGYIKLLFCTETLSVGINMPVKTAIFTDINKFDGEHNRLLYSHEYTQAAGRAGRLGLDKVGHVIHLNNIFRNVDSVGYKGMMNGKPQTLISKFKISYNLILNLIDIGNNDFIDFAEKSMIKDVIDKQLGSLYKEKEELLLHIENTELNVINKLNTPKDVVDDYLDLMERRKNVVNKKKKDVEREIQSIRDSYVTVESDSKIVEKYNEKLRLYNKKCSEFDVTKNYLSSRIHIIINKLVELGFVQIDETGKYKLTIKGYIASQIKEIHCLTFAELIENKSLTKMSARELIAVFSCFTNIVVPDDLKSNNAGVHMDTALLGGGGQNLKQVLEYVSKSYEESIDFENNHSINTGVDYNIHYDLMNYVLDWCECEDAKQCRIVLEKAEKGKQIFLGEFVKALLKINNIANEMEKVAEELGEIDFLSKLKEISILTMKYVVTNQSLYV